MSYFSTLVESYLNGSKKDPEDLATFITKRAAGAVNIEKAATNKGKFATLTAIHFKAKEIPYKNCEKHIDDEDSSFMKQEADSCLKKLKDWDTMSQREFQHIMGQLEAYGEVYIRSVKDKGK